MQRLSQTSAYRPSYAVSSVFIRQRHYSLLISKVYIHFGPMVGRMSGSGALIKSGLADVLVQICRRYVKVRVGVKDKVKIRVRIEVKKTVLVR